MRDTVPQVTSGLAATATTGRLASDSDIVQQGLDTAHTCRMQELQAVLEA
jgi:hypothetical protein